MGPQYCKTDCTILVCELSALILWAMNCANSSHGNKNNYNKAYTTMKALAENNIDHVKSLIDVYVKDMTKEKYEQMYDGVERLKKELDGEGNNETKH